jgi:hypothetical protein
MAYATFTSTITPLTVMGNKRVHRVRLAVSSYQADGIQLSARICGLENIDAVMGIVCRTIVGNGPVQFTWDDTNLVVNALQAVNSKVANGVVFNADVIVMGS